MINGSYGDITIDNVYDNNTAIYNYTDFYNNAGNNDNNYK